MNNYIAPWHIFTRSEGMPNISKDIVTPEIYYS